MLSLKVGCCWKGAVFFEGCCSWRGAVIKRVMFFEGCCSSRGAVLRGMLSLEGGCGIRPSPPLVGSVGRIGRFNLRRIRRARGVLRTVKTPVKSIPRLRQKLCFAVHGGAQKSLHATCAGLWARPERPSPPRDVEHDRARGRSRRRRRIVRIHPAAQPQLSHLQRRRAGHTLLRGIAPHGREVRAWVFFFEHQRTL